MFFLESISHLENSEPVNAPIFYCCIYIIFSAAVLLFLCHLLSEFLCFCQSWKQNWSHPAWLSWSCQLWHFWHSKINVEGNLSYFCVSFCYWVHLYTGRRDLVEFLSSHYLHINGGGGRAAGSSVQQPQCHPLQVQDEVPLQEEETMEVGTMINYMY